MIDKIYLITVYHRKKKTVIQHLISGTLKDAGLFIDYINCGVFRGRTKHITSSAAEITNDSARIYATPDDMVIDAKRGLDGDLYIYQIYRKGKTYYECTHSIDRVQQIEEALHADNIPSNAYIVNKINYRGISRIAHGEETRLNYIDCVYSKENKSVTLNEEISLNARLNAEPQGFNLG